MILALNYRELSSLINTTNRLGNELNQYCDHLSSNVQNSLYQVEGGMSSSLNSADYYVKSKITKLREKETNIQTLTSKTENLLDTAMTVDIQVARVIESNQSAFFKKNLDLKPSSFTLAMYSFWTGLTNMPVFGDRIEDSTDTWMLLSKEIRYWWECNGGKDYFHGEVDGLNKMTLATLLLISGGSTGALLANLIQMQNVEVDTWRDKNKQKSSKEIDDEDETNRKILDLKGLELIKSGEFEAIFSPLRYDPKTYSEQVVRLQEVLNELEADIEVNGYYDDSTKEAIDLIAQRYHLDIYDTSIIANNTWLDLCTVSALLNAKIPMDLGWIVTADEATEAGVVTNNPVDQVGDELKGLGVKVSGTVKVPIISGEGGVEVIWYVDDDFDRSVEGLYSNESKLIPYIYVYGELDAHVEMDQDMFKQLIGQVDHLISENIASGSASKPIEIQFDAGVFAVVGDDDFNNPYDYLGEFENSSVTINHAKLSYAQDPKGNVHTYGASYSTDFLAASKGTSSYIMINPSKIEGLAEKLMKLRGLLEDDFDKVAEGIN